MASREKLKEEINACIDGAVTLQLFSQGKLRDESTAGYSIQDEYQQWYSKALKTVAYLCRDRFEASKPHAATGPEGTSTGTGDYRPPHGAATDSPSVTENSYRRFSVVNGAAQEIDSVPSGLKGSLPAALREG